MSNAHARIIQTSPDGHALSEVASVPFVDGLENWYGGQAFVLNPDVRYQTLLGFGGAFTEASAWTLEHLDEDARDEVLRGYFCAEDGLGYTFGRTHINSCDFSLGNWACAEVRGDTELEHFSMERTERHVLPMIQRALVLADGPIQLLASPWSPPAWMKTNGQMNHGGSLLPEYRDAWARHYVRWVQEMTARGVPVWGLTVQNEPAAKQIWDSCLYTAEEERDFVRDHLGPALHAAGLDELRLIVWDHNRELAFERGAVAYRDADAAKYIWGVGLHWYAGDWFDQLDQLQTAWPDKHIIFTEGCWEGGVKLGRWDRGARYAHHIIGDLNHRCEAWIDWNMVLDHTGGPNHVGNLCDAPIIVDTEQRVVHRQSSYWYIGHFSRYLRPGAQRIGLSYIGGPLEATAFENADGSRALVVHNPSPDDVTFRALCEGRGVQVTIPATSIQTLLLGAGS